MSGCVVILYIIIKGNPNINIEIFNYIPKLAVITIVIIHFTYMTFISIMRALGVRTLIKNKKYEVRNSPIRMIQTASGKVYLCVKGFCSLMVIGGGAVGSVTAIDNLIESTNRPKIFTPIMVKYGDRLFNLIGWEKEGVITDKLKREGDKYLEQVNTLVETEKILTDLRKAVEATNTQGLPLAQEMESDFLKDLNKHQEKLRQNKDDVNRAYDLIMKGEGSTNK
uniref:hypothetical protein n=1 Tax=Conidiobolus lichenicola TaxID=1167816 RepID=UPI001D110959|nr:hypothetical protein LK371_mgp05 [Conidiobolus lichenicola]QZZ81318.1 hypothetical protein [Conidiobolus lichenicola]